jgi:DnaJ-class molecular chaperone
VNTYQALKVLNVDSSASQEEIKSSYRKMALELHPDKNLNKKEDSEFKKITEAYSILKNNSRQKNNSNQNYTKNTKTDFKRKSQWGAPDDGKIPQQDWGKYTQNMEEGNPSFWKEYEKQFWKDYNIRMKSNEEFTKYDRHPTDKFEMFVDVDKSKCIGCCSCETIAPDVFEINKKSTLNPKSSVINQKGASNKKIKTAAETCPTKAISIDNLETKERDYPL